MACAHRASTAGGGNPTTSVAIVIPASTQANDICILSVTNRDATTAPTVTDNEGAGAWARVDATADGLTVWWKRASASTAGKTVTAASLTGSCAANVTVWSGASLAASPFLDVTHEPNVSGNETHAGFTTTRDGAAVFLVVANRTNDIAIASQAATSPAAITECGEHLSTGGLDCSNTIAGEVKTTAGATGNFTWAQTDAVTVSCTFWLLPAESMDVTAGSYPYAGQTISHATNAPVAAGSYPYAGNDVAMFKSFTEAVAAGSYDYTGGVITHSAAAPVAVGSYGYAGNAIVGAVGFSTGGGEHQYSGSDVGEEYAPEVQDSQPYVAPTVRSRSRLRRR